MSAETEVDAAYMRSLRAYNGALVAANGRAEALIERARAAAPADAEAMRAAAQGAVGDFYTRGQSRRIRDAVGAFLGAAKRCGGLRAGGEPPQRPAREDEEAELPPEVRGISEAVGVEPGELRALRALPASFPHSAAALAQSLCRVTEAQQRLAYAKASIESRREFAEIQKRFPAPQIVKCDRGFGEHVELQNELSKSVVEHMKKNRELRKEIEGMETEVGEMRAKLITLLKTGFQENVNSMMQYVNRIVQIEYFILAKKKCKLMEKYYKPCCLQQNDHKNQLTEMIDQLQNSTEVEQFQNVLSQMHKLKEVIQNENNDFLQKYNEINQQLNDINQCSSEQITPQNTSRKLDEIVLMVKSFINSTTSCLESFENIEKLASSFSTPIENINFKEILYLTTAYETTQQYLDELASYTKEKISEKEQKNSEILEQIYENREDTDIISSIASVLKENRMSNEYQCKDCEKKRRFVITKCGHSFCKKCINNIFEESVWVCPYCQISVTEDDIVKINWE